MAYKFSTDKPPLVRLGVGANGRAVAVRLPFNNA